MGVATAVGVPVYDQKTFPQWLADKLLLQYRETTFIEKITTTDYTAQLDKGGVTVDITMPGAATIRDYVKGAETVVEASDPTSIQLVIDQAKEWALPVYDVDKRQATMKDYWAKSMQETGKNMAEEIESDLLDYLLDKGDAQNLGATAGLNGSYALGVLATPVTLTAATVLGILLRAGGVLTDAHVPKDPGRRFMVIPSEVAQLLKESPLGQAYVTGDATSPLRNGNIGAFDKFSLYESTRLPVSGSSIPIIFGDKEATIFYTQLQDTKKVQGKVDLHSEYWIGLQVFGRKVIRPKGLGVLWVTI